MSFITKNMYFTVSVFSKDCMSGYIHSPVLKENIEFKGLIHLILLMNKIMQDCNIPKYDEKYHSFISQNKMKIKIGYQKINSDNFEIYLKQSMKYKKECQKHFEIIVKYRQNHTWQGKIYWIDKNRTTFFRSALEMIEIIYYAL